MIPVIFSSDTTEFDTQGYGPLQCISCEVEEERNGIYELTARIPADSPRFDKLVEGNIIVATHSNKGDRQPFQIYSVEKTVDGVAEVSAEHISYRLNKNVVMPFEAKGIQAALNGLKANAVEDCPFTFWTDKESDVTFYPKVPKSIKESLYGSDGSIVDTFSTGDYEFDLFAVRLWQDRGEDNGVKIRYGYNLTELARNTDISDIYTAIVPYWTGQDDDGNERTVMLSSTPANNIVRSDYVDAFPTARTVAVDFTDKFENQPTAEELRSAAQTYLKENVRRQLITTITASFIELAQTDQYKDMYKLGEVNLCDTVTVIHEPLNIEDKLRVTRVVYDVLADRNKEVTLGDLKKTLANVIGEGTTVINKSSIGVTEYTRLKESSLPQINGVTLTGNKTAAELGIKDTNTWKVNTRTQEGYVTAPGRVSHYVWRTNSSGDPSWQYFYELFAYNFDKSENIPSGRTYYEFKYELDRGAIGGYPWGICQIYFSPSTLNICSFGVFIQNTKFYAIIVVSSSSGTQITQGTYNINFRILYSKE